MSCPSALHSKHHNKLQEHGGGGVLTLSCMFTVYLLHNVLLLAHSANTGLAVRLTEEVLLFIVHVESLTGGKLCGLCVPNHTHTTQWGLRRLRCDTRDELE